MDAKLCVMSVLSTLVVFFLCFVERGRSIHCYRCNPSPNHHGPDFCLNLKTQPKEKLAQHLQDCDIIGQNYTKCRKIYQELAEDVRVYFGCARLGEVGCFKRAGTYKIKSDYCTCDTDGCNPASSINRNTGLLVPLACTAVYFIAAAIAR